MPQVFSRERLADLLIDPREDLDLEIKNWLDLAANNDAKAIFAKAAIALANHGGGFIVLGLMEQDGGIAEAPDRPANFDSYNQDLINGIVQNYADPSFHCAVHLVPDAAGRLFPVVVVPGEQRTPVRARRSGPHGNTVEQNAIYIRKPGPRSETPQSAQDWDGLLARCLANRRDEMFDQIRSLITGAVPQAVEVPAVVRLHEWNTSGKARWDVLVNQLPEGAPARCANGYYWIGYEIEGTLRNVEPRRFPEVLQASVVRHTGWPPFWYPTRNGIQPYAFDGAVECWLGGDRQADFVGTDAAHSDFWRISPEGLAFLLRGYEEDGGEGQRPGQQPVMPGTLFDITLPVWRVGETMLQSAMLARNLVDGPATISFVVHYSGLAGRTLTSLSGMRHIWEGRISRQNEITLRTRIAADSIEANLPEIIQPLVAPLYNLFDFFDLSMNLVAEELARMRGGRN